MIKPFIRLLAWFAGGIAGAIALFLVFAPYLASVFTNIGRRPVMLRPTPARTVRRRLPQAQRSAAH
jgi:hypothetical protein